MDEIKRFLRTYGGAIIGALVAILILCTHLYDLIIWIVFICLGIFVGNYATPINFPQTFKEPPEVLIDLKLRAGACFKVEWEIPIITTSSYKNIGIGRGTSSNAVDFTITLYAIGKWK